MKYLLSLTIILLAFQTSVSQIYLQIEKRNDPKSKRFITGQKLTFTLKKTPEIWRTELIRKMDYDQNLIVLEEGYRYLDEFDRIRLYRPWARKLGMNMMRFSAGWFLYGGVATAVSSNYNMGLGEIVIGGAFAGVGFLLDKLFYKRTIRLGNKFRLRIVDLRMYVPETTYEPVLLNRN